MPARVPPTERIRAEIDELFAADRDLGEVLEDAGAPLESSWLSHLRGTTLRLPVILGVRERSDRDGAYSSGMQEARSIA